MKHLAVALLVLGGLVAWGQSLGSLTRVSVPEPAGLSRYVRDQKMLVALGKAWFWDMQAGSDGRVACASCHFHAGADHREQNQLANPSGSFPVNHALRHEDFPFRVLANPDDNRSSVLRDAATIAGSAGLFRRIFVDIVPDSASDDGYDSTDAPAFSLNGVNTRRVTARNSPTVINSVFYVRNFWDGRASSIFTGLTPFGESDSRLNALAVSNGRLVAESVRITNSSLASQAVGPPLNDVEMSYEGRTFRQLGRKLLGLKPLALQIVAPDDSVLGPLTNPAGRGLHPQLTYLGMVQAAFQPEYWSAAQAELNFPLFWGLAIQAYEATLISDDSRFDRFSDGEGDALSAEEQLGLSLFRATGGCTNCHVGPEFSMAATTAISQRGAVQRLRNGNERDTGFFRIGVRPIEEDIGLGADDGLGRPLAAASTRTTANGAFKTPTLRNVEFTGPYFHNGGQATLGQVVDFYLRGGDFPDGGNLGPGIRRRNLSPADRQALVAFLKSLSDDRVRFERAPFDHPELCISVGHVEGTDGRFPMSASDRWVALPAVGKNGNAVPLQTFDELLSGIGADGSRAHALTEACTIP